MAMRAENRFDKMRALLYLLEKNNKSRALSFSYQDRFANSVLIQLLDNALVDVSFDMFDNQQRREEARTEKKRRKEATNRFKGENSRPTQHSRAQVTGNQPPLEEGQLPLRTD